MTSTGQYNDGLCGRAMTGISGQVRWWEQWRRCIILKIKNNAATRHRSNFNAKPRRRAEVQVQGCKCKEVVHLSMCRPCEQISGGGEDDGFV